MRKFGVVSAVVIYHFFGVPTPAKAEKIAQFAVALDTCSSNEMSLDLGDNFPSAGAIEILYPLPDTDGRGDVRYNSTRTVCIPFQAIVDWEKSKSSIPPEISEYDATFFVTYDPRGTLLATRSRFNYDVLMCEELPDTPRPPKDLKFGTFNWTSTSGIKAQKVSWIPDLRAKLEADCK
jgi:hypothetical protein